MAVYVDDLKDGHVVRVLYPSAPRCFKRDGCCHMWADTPDELHAFARRLGLKRAWFQDHRLLPHYDLTGPRLIAALKLGAQAVDPKAFIRSVRARMSAAEAE
jgi:hypothetical protein